MSALIEWYAEQNGGPYAATQTISFSNELPVGGAFTVAYGFRNLELGLGTFTAQWNWTDPAGDTQSFTTAGLAFLGKASIVGSFTMWKQPRDANPAALFELVMTKTNILGGGSWDGHFRIV